MVAEAALAAAPSILSFGSSLLNRGAAKRAEREARGYRRKAAGVGAAQWADYQANAMPIMAALASDALEGTGSDRYRGRIGAAGADADLAFGQAHDNIGRTLGRYGGATGMHQGTIRDLSIQQALAKAGNMTNERRMIDDEIERRQHAVAAMYARHPGQAIAAFGGASGGAAALGRQFRGAQGEDLHATGQLGLQALDDWEKRRMAKKGTDMNTGTGTGTGTGTNTPPPLATPSNPLWT